MESGENTVIFGKSILVPSVQELAKDCINEIPEIYDRSNEKVDDCIDEELEVPIINMQALLSGDEVELEKLHSACQDWGFFQAINHGVDLSLVEKLKMETREFFNLPLEEKKKYSQTANDFEGYGQAFVVSEDQKRDWADVFSFAILPKHLRKPHLLPMLPLPYRDTLENFSAEVQNLAIKLLDCMSKALKVNSEVLRGVFGDQGFQSYRMNYYPPCPQPEKVIGLTAHSDADSLTILLQSDEIVGLQIWKDANWIPVKPLPDAFVVNIGDILEIATNGKYRSILHRSVVNATKERVSIATFHSPALDGEIGPIPELINPGSPARFRQICVTDYYKGFFSRALDDKSYLDAMRIDATNGTTR